MYPSHERQRGVVIMNHCRKVVAWKWSIAQRSQEARRFPVLREGFLNRTHFSLIF